MRKAALLKLLPLLLVSLFIFACAQNRPSAPSSQTDYYEHMVSYPGETIGLISKWYTGSSENWREILSFNPRINVYKLKVGDYVDIPRYLVRQTQPMPKSFIGKFSESARSSEKPFVAKQAPVKPAAKGEKQQETRAVSPENALPSVTKENPAIAAPAESAPAVNAEQARQATDAAANIAREQAAKAQEQIPAAAADAQVKGEVPVQNPAPAAVAPAKSRDELLRELLDEGAKSGQ